MFSVSSYFSVEYLLILLPLCILLYLMLPKTARRVTLLFFSYAFFWAVCGRLIVYLLAATLIVYAFGLWLGKILDAQKQALAACEKSEKKAVRSRYHTKLLRIVVLAVLLQIGVLLVLKYSPFFSDNLNSLLRILHIIIQTPDPDIFPDPADLLQRKAPVPVPGKAPERLQFLIDDKRQKAQQQDPQRHRNDAAQLSAGRMKMQFPGNGGHTDRLPLPAGGCLPGRLLFLWGCLPGRLPIPT